MVSSTLLRSKLLVARAVGNSSNGLVMGGKCRPFSSLHQEFEQKIALGKTLPPLDDNMTKLKMYSLFKQANVGKNTTQRPGMLDFVGKAKWDAWTQLGDMSQEEAMKQYMAIIDDLVKQHQGEASSETSASSSSTSATTDDLLVNVSDDGLLTIALNRPKKYNALKLSMYQGITDALQSAKRDKKVKAVLLKSMGNTMFSSGNDLSMFAPSPNKSFEQMAEEGAQVLEKFVDAFITCPKPIVASVHAPAIGISVTILALCDLVYANEKATFTTPFTSLGQSPEGCSSVLFSQIMGKAQANAMLLLGEPLTAQQALNNGFVTAIFGEEEFEKQVDTKVKLLLSRYPNSLLKTKALLQTSEQVQKLQEVNHREAQVLKKLWLSPECMDAMMKFQNRKK